MQRKTERLQKILSANGITSRREAERMITEGRVSVNGIQAAIGQSAQIGVDCITVDGMPIIPLEEHVYLMLNKPRGYLTTSYDDRGRQTVMELICDIDSRVYPVGRLDLNSEGLLLLTNDGDFANAVMHPSFNKQKTYEVTVRGDVKKAAELLRLPVSIDKFVVQALKVELIDASPGGGTLFITIAEGRNRQVRKMCAACGLNVDTLRRTSIGELCLGDLKTGKWRHLTENEVAAMFNERKTQ